MKVDALVYNEDGSFWGYQLHDKTLLPEREVVMHIDEISNLQMINGIVYETEDIKKTDYKTALGKFL